MKNENELIIWVACAGERLLPGQGKQLAQSLRDSLGALEDKTKLPLTLAFPIELQHLGEEGWPVVAALARDMQLESLPFSLQASDAVIAELSMRGLDEIIEFPPRS